jgi:hypothetical protein
MTDVLVSFCWQIHPDQRGLYHKPGRSRWYFPKDYPHKVTAAVKRLMPAATPPAIHEQLQPQRSCENFAPYDEAG